MADFLMPSLGADMEAGRLVEWRVRPGDHVERGDIIAVIETDKAAIDVEVWETGTVEALLVEEGTRVPVGTPLARIGSGAAVPSTAAPPGSSAEAPPMPPRIEVAPASEPPPAPTAGASAAPAAGARLRVTPLARVRAEELGVDLGRVHGTGAEGAITQADVERAAEGAPPEPPAAEGASAAPPAAEEVPQPVAPPPEPAAPPPSSAAAPEARSVALRRAIAAAMSRSNRDIPHYYLSMAVDLSSTLAWLERTNQQRGVAARLLPAALFVRAVALATREVPEMSGHYLDGEFRRAEAAHVGFAVAVPGGGLIAPAILEADRKPLADVMAELRGLVSRARAGTLRSSELSDPTITISSLGERGGVDTVFGIINPPQVALVGFGSIVERPWAEGGLVGAHRQVTVSLSGDHRVSDGHRGALFLAAIDRLLRDPEHL